MVPPSAGRVCRKAVIMEGVRHPFTQALYEKDGDGNVRVTTRDGKVGIYRGDGSWISGEKLDVDLHLCGWVSGPRTRHRLR